MMDPSEVQFSKYDESIALSVLDSILDSNVLAMDETPVKAGRVKPEGAKHGKMKTGYFWPIYGDRDEVYFSFAPTRGSQHVENMLSEFKGILISDGYSAYASYVDKVQGVTAAQCWAHARRYFENALDYEPDLANIALDFIGALYANETAITEQRLDQANTLAFRLTHSEPIVNALMCWCKNIAFRPDLIALGSPVRKAANYVLAREGALKVFLSDPAVQIDTNHVERILRVIPMGRNYPPLFFIARSVESGQLCWAQRGFLKAVNFA